MPLFFVSTKKSLRCSPEVFLAFFFFRKAAERVRCSRPSRYSLLAWCQSEDLFRFIFHLCESYPELNFCDVLASVFCVVFSMRFKSTPTSSPFQGAMSQRSALLVLAHSNFSLREAKNSNDRHSTFKQICSAQN